MLPSVIGEPGGEGMTSSAAAGRGAEGFRGRITEPGSVGKQTGTGPVTEAVLNRISGNRGGIAGVYQRHDWAAEKRAALDAWAAHVLAAAEGWSPSHNVVKLGRTG